SPARWVMTPVGAAKQVPTGQPEALTCVPEGVFGQASTKSTTPSPSASAGDTAVIEAINPVLSKVLPFIPWPTEKSIVSPAFTFTVNEKGACLPKPMTLALISVSVEFFKMATSVVVP